MSVESDIKSIVEGCGVTYIYEDWTRANLQLDRALRSDELKFPVCINLLPVSGTLSFKAGVVKDAPNCLIAFADKADLDFDGATNQATVEKMKNLAKLFISRVSDSGLFDPVDDDVSYSVFYDKLDVNITGVTIDLKLTQARGICPEDL